MNSTYTNDGQLGAELCGAFVNLSLNSEIWHSNFNHAVQTVARACSQALAVERASIWLLNDAGRSLVCQTLYLAEQARFSAAPKRKSCHYPTYFQAIASEKIIAADDAANDPRTVDFLNAYPQPVVIGAILSAGICYQGDAVGFLCLEHEGLPRHWKSEEQNFAASVGDLLSQLVMFHRSRESGMRYRKLFETVGDAIFILSNGTFIDCNVTAMKMFGAERQQIIRRSPARFSPRLQADGQISTTKAQARVRAAEKGETQFFEWRCQTLQGEIFETEVTLSATELAGKHVIFAVLRDITARKRAATALLRSKQALEHQAHHDSLTGLPNRGRLHDIAGQAIESARAKNQALGMMLLDLDRFKEVNDTLGHHMGDKLLKQLSQRLQQLLHSRGAQLYRLGGDEFAILIPELAQTEDALPLGEAVNDNLRQPFELDGVTLELSGSIGMAVYPQHGNNSHDLLRCADVAMYHAKSRTTGLSVYAPELDSHSPRRLTMIGDLGSAIRNNQLLLEFQPRIELSTGRCMGCEALVRWPHPEFGLIAPAEFIPLAEMGELIRPLTLWVLREALEQISEWAVQDIQLPIAINLSPRNLMDTVFPKQVKQLVGRFKIPPEMLEFEITERAILNDPQRASRVIAQLHNYGVRLVIDNFGTGYSSLTDLKRLPVSLLKIDRSFTADMLNNEQDITIVQSVIDLGHRFGMTVVAEGVENAEVAEALRQNKCDGAQGFHFCKPMTGDALHGWLESLKPGQIGSLIPKSHM